MFNIPEKYKLNKRLNKENFISRLEKNDLERFKQAVKSIYIIAQINGEELPSFVDEKNNAQVIVFIKIMVDNLKNCPMIAKEVHFKMKPLTVILLEDEIGNMKLSFATKRLSEG